MPWISFAFNYFSRIVSGSCYSHWKYGKRFWASLIDSCYHLFFWLPSGHYVSWFSEGGSWLVNLMSFIPGFAHPFFKVFRWWRKRNRDQSGPSVGSSSIHSFLLLCCTALYKAWITTTLEHTGLFICNVFFESGIWSDRSCIPHHVRINIDCRMIW